MKTRVKVRTADLLKAVEAKRESVVKRHLREVETYDQRLADYQEKLAKALIDAAEKLTKTGKVPNFNSYSGTFAKVKAPVKPELNTHKIDRTIATLKIAADDSISVTADDYAEYIA